MSVRAVGTQARLNPIQEQQQQNSLADKEDAPTPPHGCTTGCTNEAETTNAGTVEALAAALLKLSPADRTRLAAMLLTGNQEPAYASTQTR